MHDTLIVKVEDLSKGSNKEVEYLCDYCLENGIETKLKAKYFLYLRGRQTIQKDSCNKCKYIKVKEVNLFKYGVENHMQLEEIKNKFKKYNLEKYGVEWFTQTDYFKNSVIQTNLKRYGVKNPLQSPKIIEKMKNTNLERYGVECVFQNEDIIKKINNSLYKNGTCKTSSQQIEIYDLLKNNNYNVDLNYPVSRCNLDVALFINNIKIDIEYDCWYWHQNQQKDRRRDEFLKSQGWKILRIKSGHKIPSLKQIQEGIFKLVNSDRTYTQIVLDDWKEKINNFKEEF